MAEAAVLTSLGWLASPLMKTLFDKAYHHLGTGIDKRMEKLVATVLPRLSLAIEMAEKSPKMDKLVAWLKRLKDAYYEAQEAIDRFEYELLKQKVKDDRKTLEQKEKNKRGTRISLPSQFVLRPLKIASIKLKYGLSVFSRKKIKLKGCIDKLIEIAKEAKEFCDLLEIQENASGRQRDRETFSEPPIKVFGREIDKENIVNLLTKKPLISEPEPSTRPAIPIIAITGRSGVGKTALAQYVCKHMDGQEHFNLHVWVHAPRKFNATDVIKDMIEIIKAKECARNDNPSTSLEALLLIKTNESARIDNPSIPFEALFTQIKSMLGSKKLLLVLDDLWSDTEDFFSQWDNFFSCLRCCLPESRILITTQSKNAAQQAGKQVEIYYLQEIKEDPFLELFMHYAWTSKHLPKEKFKKVGKKIADKLKGDPGAAKLVGHQLSGKLDLRHWEKVAEKDWFGDNMKVRIWSYQQLPPNLQRCFALYSLFPKGMKLPGPFIIKLWMAEGFIRPIDEKETLEDIGENYLEELVSRFFFEQVVDEKEICYQLHDLLHDLAEQVQGDDFIRIDSSDSREVPSHIRKKLSKSENIGHIRHISLPSSMINELKEKLCLMRNICTLWVVPDDVVQYEVLQEILKNLRKLRVLVLQLPEGGDDLLDSIGNLKHLRFLFIYESWTPIKKLPDSICKLYHLQTVYLPSCESLPKDFSELISLRSILFGKKTPSISHIGRLTSLQGLHRFIVRKESGNELHQLKNLNQLRGELCIAGLENVGSIADAVNANMENKEHLEKLEFKWKSGDTNDDPALHVQLLDALQPHRNISELTLQGFTGERFPNWLLSQNSPSNLTSLTLIFCLKVEEIPSIDKSLPNCTSLLLRGLTKLKKMPSVPPNLTYLEIEHNPQLSYFSETDLLMKEETMHSNLEAVKQIAECLKLMYTRKPQEVEAYVRLFLEFVRERLKVAQSERVPPLVTTCSLDLLLDGWVKFMHYHMDTMFDKNEEYKLILPSSLTHLKISSCSITCDALSTCIRCLVSLSKLELCHILTITSLPLKKDLCSLKKLQSLIIMGCYLLSSLGGIRALTSLKELELKDCLKLNTSNEPFPSSLERLTCWDCSNVDVILAKSNLPVLHALQLWNITFKNRRGVLRVGHLSCLKDLAIDGWDGQLEGLKLLTALHRLMVKRCPVMKPSSPMDKYASALKEVAIDNLLSLKIILSIETISSIDSLVILRFQGDSSDDEIFQSIPSLRILLLRESNITHLPKYFKNLTSLRYMYLDKCPNLCELEELPRNLRELNITNCPALMEKFNKGGPHKVCLVEGSTVVTFPTKKENHF